MTPMRLALLVLVLLLGGCATSPGIPDTTYFRLPPRKPMAAAERPVSVQPIVVETLLADGLHSDQAIIYSLDPEGARLRAYHYQLWVDPPVRMLQRRMIGALRDARVAGIVTDRLPAQVASMKVEGRIERFERVKTATGWHVAVSLSLRADARDGKPPLVLREYAVELPTDGDSVRDSVNAMGAALDQIFEQFVTELRGAAPDA